MQRGEPVIDGVLVVWERLLGLVAWRRVGLRLDRPRLFDNGERQGMG